MWTLRRPVRPQPSAEPVTPDDVAGLLAEVRALRLTMSTDLSLAAGALDADAPDVAAEVIDAERAELAAFRARAEARLAALPPAEPEEDRPVSHRGRSVRRRLLPATPVLAAAGLATAIAVGALPLPSHGGEFRPQPASSSWQAFSRAASDHSAAVLAAAKQLHESVESLIAEARHDPTAGAQAMLLLQMERAILLHDQPPGAAQLLAQAQHLVDRLTATLPQLPTTLDGVKERTGRYGPSAYPTVNPSPSATPAPQPSASAPAPSASPPAPSASPTPPPTLGPLPGGESFAP